MKPALLLLHGALGSQAQFLALREMLNDQFNVHLLDFSGHGTRPSANEFSIDRFVVDVVELVTNHNLQRIAIFGHSMGGYVGLQYARDHPDKVSGIITLGTKFHWTEETTAKEIKMLDPDIIEIKAPAFADMLRLRHGEQNWKEVLHNTKSLMLGLGYGLALTDNDFKKINCPVLITRCEMDNMVSIEESMHAAKVLPHGAFKMIDGCQHPLEKVDIQSIATIIREMYLEN